MRPRLALLILLLLGGTSVVDAQTTRRGEMAQAKAAKAKTLRPYEPNRVEEAIGALTSGAPRRVYPWFGGQFEGAGFSLGVGVRRFIGDTSFADAHAVWSMRNFKTFDVSFTRPTIPGARPTFHARAGWRDAPAYPFYGIGADSAARRLGGQVEEWFAAGEVNVRPTSWAFLHGGLGFRRMDSGPGKGSGALSTGVAPDAIPGFGASPHYVTTAIEAGLDTRPSPGYSTHGSLLRARPTLAIDTHARHASFRQLDVEAIQLVPIVRAHWVLGLRAAATMADPLSGDTVPWFMLPTLGGSTTLRAYPWGRFRDRRTVLAAAEWRWFINRALDLAIFYETGAVAPRWSAFHSRTLRPSYGVGARLHGPSFTAIRAELAHGREGWQAVFSFGPAF